MTKGISERAFEEVIECALLRHGPDACPGDDKEVRESPPTYDIGLVPGGYLKRGPEDYDRGLCLIPDRCGRLYPSHATQRVGQARAAPRR